MKPPLMQECICFKLDLQIIFPFIYYVQLYAIDCFTAEVYRSSVQQSILVNWILFY